MARLARKNLKVFANAAANNGQFGSAQLGTKLLTNDIEEIQALAAWDNGWNDATITAKRFPTLEETQALDYVKTYQLAYLFQEGIPEWYSTAVYYQNSIVKKSGTYELYGSKIDNNSGNALPVAMDDANWQFLQDISTPPVVAQATEVALGVAELATQAKTNTGTDDLTIVTPKKLSGRTATEIQTGILAVATQAVTNAGMDDTTAITPKKLSGRQATEVLFGITENATLAEALAGVDDVRYISPAKLAAVLALLSQVPTGTLLDFAGAAAPAGYLLCFGQLVSRTTYAALFAVLGTTFGAGDGVTTFGLPDLRGRLAAGKDNMGGTAAGRLTGQAHGVNGTAIGAAGGEETHVLLTAELSSHQHFVANVDTASPADTLLATNTLATQTFGTPTNTSNALLTGTATPATLGKSSVSGSDTPHNNVQPTIIINKIIKI